MPARARIVSRRAGPGARRKEALGTGNHPRIAPSAFSALSSHMSPETGSPRHQVRWSRMRFSIRSRALAWPTGWILPLPPPIHVQEGLGFVEDPVVFDGSGHGLRVSPGHRLGQFTISCASVLL